MTDSTLLPTAPRTIPRDQHAISRKDISPSALRVLYRLHEAGYGAYLVGGAVRDLLLPLERQAIAHRAADHMSSQTELSDGERAGVVARGFGCERKVRTPEGDAPDESQGRPV